MLLIMQSSQCLPTPVCSADLGGHRAWLWQLLLFSIGEIPGGLAVLPLVSRDSKRVTFSFDLELEPRKVSLDWVGATLPISKSEMMSLNYL